MDNSRPNKKLQWGKDPWMTRLLRHLPFKRQKPLEVLVNCCAVCGQVVGHLIGQVKGSRRDWSTKKKMSEWRSGAAEACPLCQLIVSGIELCEIEGPGKTLFTLQDDSEVFIETHPLRATITQSGSRHQRVMVFYIAPSSVEDQEGASTYLDIFKGMSAAEPACSSKTGTLECFTGIANKLETCLREHTTCPNFDQHVLPRRVIDVGVYEDSTPRLIESEGRARYICLSHRWRDTNPLTTTKTLEDRLAGIPNEEIPLVFKQVFEAARRLQVRYVWIDCLCIIQDDPQDWAEQSSQMADIYGNCLICFASASATEFNGLLYGPDHGGAGPFTCPEVVKQIAPAFSYESLKVNVQEITFGGSSSYSRLDTHMPKLGELFQRGWCHQELFLSPRLVIFRSTNLLWACSEQQASCLDYPVSEGSGMRVVLDATPGALSKHAIGPRRDGLASSMNKDALFDLWSQEVETYSGKLLTNRSDYLPAFSGMARRFVDLGVDGQYWAGIWQQDAWRGLCWSRESGLLVERPGYRAPTFSWASVEGPVKLGAVIVVRYRYGSSIDRKYPQDEQKVEILDGRCQPSTIDGFGAVSDGHIRLRGHTVWATYDGDSNSVQGEYGSKAVVVPEYGRWNFQIDCLDPIEVGHEVCLLWMGLTRSKHARIFADKQDKRRIHSFLVLKRSKCAGSFERIGIAGMCTMFFGTGKALKDIPFEKCPVETLTIV